MSICVYHHPPSPNLFLTKIKSGEDRLPPTPSSSAPREASRGVAASILIIDNL